MIRKKKARAHTHTHTHTHIFRRHSPCQPHRSPQDKYRWRDGDDNDDGTDQMTTDDDKDDVDDDVMLCHISVCLSPSDLSNSLKQCTKVTGTPAHTWQ